MPIAAFIGGLGAAALLYALSWLRGIDGQRFILVGIGLSYMLIALTDWLLTKARIQDAQSAQVWLNGSLNGRGWEHATPLLWTMAVLVPVALILVRSLNTMQLGDDSASSLGVRLQPVQLLTLLAAVGLAAVAVSAVGPLGFVALVVPQIALRLTGGPAPDARLDDHRCRPGGGRRPVDPRGHPVRPARRPRDLRARSALPDLAPPPHQQKGVGMTTDPTPRSPARQLPHRRLRRRAGRPRPLTDHRRRPGHHDRGTQRLREVDPAAHHGAAAQADQRQVLLDGEPVHQIATRDVAAGWRCCRRARSRPTG